MRLDRPAGVAFLIVALGSGREMARGAGSVPASTLRDRGLTKSGQVHVIEAEKPDLAKIKEVRAAFAS